MAPPLVQLRDIALTFGGTPLLTQAELSVAAGERVCLVGRNGSGKSTLLKVAAGLIEADRGSRFVQPGATVRYLPQEPDFSGFATTLAYVEAGLGPGDDPHQARWLLEQLSLTGEENPAQISGGEARRAALARVLAPAPDILLLDEPTNHLDLPTIEWLESELESRRCALVLISHDRRFLENLSRATIWLDRGTTRRIDRGFAHFEAWRDEVLAEEERDQHKLDRKIVAEEHWLRYGVTARRKRNVRRLGGLIALRQARRDYRASAGKASLATGAADASGVLVIEAEHISKSYDGRPIVADFSTRIRRGDRLGIIGPNGSGKTTLLSLLTGAIAPDDGEVRLGANLAMATLEQSRDSLDPNATVAETLTGGHGDTVTIAGKPKHVIGYMKDFLFAPEQARTPLSVLSGGERGRLMLARALGETLERFWSSTSPPTISTSKPSTSSRRCSPTTKAPCWSSATTATSSTASSPASSRPTTGAAGSNMRAAIRTCSPSAARTWSARRPPKPSRTSRARRSRTTPPSPNRAGASSRSTRSTPSTPCPPPWRRSTTGSPPCTQSSTIPASTPATARRSTQLPPRLPLPRPS